MGEELLAA